VHSGVAAAPAFRHGRVMKRLFWLFACVTACHSASVPEARLPDGSWHLTCGSALDHCVDRANELCGGRGYVVLGGTNKRTLFGSADGVSQVETREADLTVACADHQNVLPKVLVSNTVVRGASAPPPPQVSAAPASPSKVACTPGSTQQCVGAGACAGGQACLPDGSGFSACDCGGASKAATAPTGS